MPTYRSCPAKCGNVYGVGCVECNPCYPEPEKEGE
jgi:hypothetical protein